MLRAPKLVLTDADRRRLDESPDADFYGTPRMMQHADEAFIAALSTLYSIIIPQGSCVLELCASRYSHLPDSVHINLLVGQGMNSQELAANPSLHQHFVQDLNLQPQLLEQLDSSYHAVLCVNGIQYLTQPETVFAEASRVLRPGGVVVVAFGPDCFKGKATAAWLNRNMQERAALVQTLLQANGFDVAAVLDSPAAVAAFSTSASLPSSDSPAAQLPGLSSVAVGGAAAAGVTAADGILHPAGSVAVTAEMCVIVAAQSQDWTAGAAAADTAGGVDMRPDNVSSWFTKPGLAGLAEAASAQTQQPSQPSTAPPAADTPSCTTNTPTAHSTNTSSPASPPNPPSPTGLSPLSPAPGAAVPERLLEQWHAAYESLVVDAVDLGIPRSVIPAVKAEASPQELQEAVQHLQAMMASFLSAGL